MFFNFYLENYLSNKKILNKENMHLDAKSKHIFFILNFYAFRLFIDYRETTVQFKCRVPLFDQGIQLSRYDEYWKKKFNQFLKKKKKKTTYNWKLDFSKKKVVISYCLKGKETC